MYDDTVLLVLVSQLGVFLVPAYLDILTTGSQVVWMQQLK